MNRKTNRTKTNRPDQRHLPPDRQLSYTPAQSPVPPTQTQTSHSKELKLSYFSKSFLAWNGHYETVY